MAHSPGAKLNPDPRGAAAPQGSVFIRLDKDMRDAATNEWARGRNSNIIEDLGRVSYVFSDKTGTLTSNEMRLRLIAVKGVPYGLPDYRSVCLRACLPARPSWM
jgi:hypothetical protein